MSRFANAINADGSGYTRVKMADIISDLNAIVLAAGGSDTDIDPRSPVGQGIGGIAEMLSDLEGIAADVYAGLTNPNGATGAMLSGQMVLTGCPRNVAVYATAPATFTGTPGTVIGTTKNVQSTVDGSIWNPLSAVTIGGGGTVAGTLIAKVIGPLANGGPPAAGTLTIIQSVTSGWSAVTNAVGTPGTLVEGDPNGRVRRQQSTAIASQAMTDGLQAAIKALPGVLDAVVWENNTTLNVTIGDGNVIGPNSLWVIAHVTGGGVADPALTSSSTDPIANRIFALKGNGCNTQGSTTKHPLDAVGNSHVINYDLATPLEVIVRINVLKRYNWPTDGDAQIKQAIASWAAGTNASTGKPNIQISGNDLGLLSWTDVLAAFLNVVPGFDFVGMSFSSDAGATWTTPPNGLPVPFGRFVEISNVSVTAT